MQDKSCQVGCSCELFEMQGAENTASQLTNKKKIVLLCKGSLQTSVDCGVPKRGKTALPVGAAPRGGCTRFAEKLRDAGL